MSPIDQKAIIIINQYRRRPVGAILVAQHKPSTSSDSDDTINNANPLQIECNTIIDININNDNDNETPTFSILELKQFFSQVYKRWKCRKKGDVCVRYGTVKISHQNQGNRWYSEYYQVKIE